MTHIYTNRETKVSLWQDDYNDELPYVIKVGEKIVCRCDKFADAYREYNTTIVKKGKS